MLWKWAKQVATLLEYAGYKPIATKITCDFFAASKSEYNWQYKYALLNTSIFYSNYVTHEINNSSL